MEPDATVLDACQALKEAGYLLALDDFTVDNEVQRSIVEIADIIKADFMHSTPVERATIVKKFSDGQKRFLGEKVETPGGVRGSPGHGVHVLPGLLLR